MSEPHDAPEPQVVNVFEVLRQVGDGTAFWNETAFWNDSAVMTCAEHISDMMDAAQDRERWALMMVDASAKLPEPLLGGLNLHLGDYDQCLGASTEAFAGRYCLVQSLGQRIATCVPSTCTSRTLDLILSNSSDNLVHVPQHTCQSAVDPFVFHPATAVLGVVVLLALLNALGWFMLTYENVRKRVPSWWRPSPVLAMAMSPITAWRKIIASSKRLDDPAKGPGDTTGTGGSTESPGGADGPSGGAAGPATGSPGGATGSSGGATGSPGGATPPPGGATGKSGAMQLKGLPAKAETGGATGSTSTAEVEAGDAARTEASDETRRTTGRQKSLTELEVQWAETRMLAANGVRTLSMAWVVMGHREALMPLLPVLDKRALPQRMQQWTHVYVPAGLFAVDTFLLVAGCVLAYSFSIHRRRHPPTRREFLPWLGLFYLHRYIRLTPLLAFTVLMYAGGLLYFGQGPLWDEFSAFDVTSCRNNWWPDFLYIHNYYNNRQMCVGHSWYLAVDMQLYLISPLLLFPMFYCWESVDKYLGRFVYSFFFILSVVIPFVLVVVYDLTPAPNPLGDPIKYLQHSELVYIPAHARASPWVVGVFVGLWAARVVADRRALGRWAVRGLWCVAALGLLGLPLGLTAALRSGDQSSRWGSAAFVALSKPLWAVGVGAVLLLCASGRAPRLHAVLSWDPFGVLARLSFAVYLLHPTVQGITGWSTRGTTVATDVVVIPLVIADLVLAFVVALPVSILFESPFIALERLLVKREKDRSEAARPSTPPSAPPGAPPAQHFAMSINDDPEGGEGPRAERGQGEGQEVGQQEQEQEQERRRESEALSATSTTYLNVLD